MKVNIKPLSVNQCWRGRRFKTDKYKKYETDLLKMLLPVEIPEGRLKVYLKFGLSSKLADVDNPVKAFVDILQKRYNFNDKDIYKMLIVKEDVKKGDEYIDFKIMSYKA